MVPEDLLVNILGQARTIILEDIAKGKSFISGKDFENHAYQRIKEVAINSGVSSELIVQSGPQTFPDIVIENWGIEIKRAKKDSWQSTGNSIREGTKVKGLQQTYLFFLKECDNPDIKYGLYEDYLSEVVVTHSPRYLIDMNINPNENIFSKINESYENFTGGEAIKIIKKYYAGQKKDLWWIDNQEEETVTDIYAKTFTDLNDIQRKDFIVKSFALFPELWGSNHRIKFKRAAILLIEEYGCVSTNLRDIFTAGGQSEIHLNGQIIRIPKMLALLRSCAAQIKNFLQSSTRQELEEIWDISLTNKNPENKWLELISQFSGNDLVKKVYLQEVK